MNAQRSLYRGVLPRWWMWIAALTIVIPTPVVADEPAHQKDMAAGLAPLEIFVGLWNVRQHHFDELGNKITTVKGTEEIVWVLNKRSIRRTYSTTGASTNFRAIGMFTWDNTAGKYDGVWFDNVSTSGPTVVEATWNANKRTMVLSLRAVGPTGSPIKYKVVERFVDIDHRVATTYLLRDSETIKLIEVEYTRAEACPDRIRFIYDGVEEYKPE